MTYDARCNEANGFDSKLCTNQRQTNYTTMSFKAHTFEEGSPGQNLPQHMRRKLWQQVVALFFQSKLSGYRRHWRCAQICCCLHWQASPNNPPRNRFNSNVDYKARLNAVGWIWHFVYFSPDCCLPHILTNTAQMMEIWGELDLSLNRLFVACLVTEKSVFKKLSTLSMVKIL